MEGKLPETEVVRFSAGGHKGDDYQDGGQDLGADRGNGYTQHSHVEYHYQQKVQHDVAQRGSDQEVQRPLGISYRSQYAGSHIVNHIGDHAQEIDPQVQNSVRQCLRRGVHSPQRPRSKSKAHYSKECTHHDREQHGGVYALIYLRVHPGAIPLGNGHHGAAGKTGKDANCQIGNDAGGAHGGQSGGAYKTAHHHSIHGIVQLLEEGAEPQGKEKCQQLFPDHALGNVNSLARFVHKRSLRNMRIGVKSRCCMEDSTCFRRKRQEEFIGCG